MFNCCVFSMIFDDNNSQQVNPDDSAMNVFSIDENKILDANGEFVRMAVPALYKGSVYVLHFVCFRSIIHVWLYNAYV